MHKFPILLALFFLGVVAGTAGCAPAPTSPSASLGNVSKQAGDFTVLLLGTPNPPVRGGNTLEAVITDSKGQAVDDAKVSVDLDMTNMSHGKTVVPATPRGGGRYAAAVNFLMGGPWRVIVIVERAGQPVQSVRFDFSVNAR
jgi:hypothetical protein